MATNSRSSRTSMRSKQIGQLLIESGDANADQVAEALKTQEAHGGMLGAILREMGACSDQALAQALAKQVQVTEIQCVEVTPSAEALEGISIELCQHEKFCPFELLGNTLCVVMGNPLNRKAVTDLEHMTGKKVKTFKAHWHDIQPLIERAFAQPNGGAEMEGEATEPEPLSLDLELDVPVAANAPAKPMPKNPAPQIVARNEPDEALELDDIPDIIPPAAAGAAQIQPAGPTGILEIPQDDEVPAPAPVEVPLPKPVKQQFNPNIKGLDTLDSADAEIVNMAKRPSASAASVKVEKPKPPKKEAKVNVDLDSFDLTTPSETISVPHRPEQEALDEIQHIGVEGGGRSEGEVLLAFTLVPDSYFYAGPAPKNAPRSEELMDIIEALPVAEVLAPDINAYERAKSGEFAEAETGSGPLVGIGLLGKNRIELQRAPATPMTAIRLGEGEFQKLTLTSVEDLVGEWDWKFTAPGPVAVEVFED